MAAPRLILRFREFNAELDTITEHNRVFDRCGRAVWGWWRKEDQEPDQEKALLDLRLAVPFTTRFINAEAKRCFECEVGDVLLNLGDVAQEYIPKYYRDQAEGVSAWFSINTRIREIDYDWEMASQIGRSTLLIVPSPGHIGPQNVQPLQTIRARRGPEISPIILHLSDIHFGRQDHAFLMDGEAQDSGASVRNSLCRTGLRH